MTSKSSGFFKQAHKMRLIRRVFYGFCGVLVLIDLGLLNHHTQHPWEQLPGFYALFGLIFCLLLMGLSKLLAIIVRRGSEYYDN